LITGKDEAAKLSKNTSKAVMVLTIVERPTAKTAYLSGKINTIQLPDVSARAPTRFVNLGTLSCQDLTS
ncbi:MAG: hypothetical protein H9847_07290, partial [Candidatus Anaerobiospirillum pullicola]|nr:hypothetical protein [Candidatus Anaerobiospirillum pullicola]